MKKIYLLLCLSLYACTGSDNKPLDGGPEDISSEAIHTNYEDAPEKVHITINYPDGNLHKAGDLYQGRKSGAWVEYHPNGMVKATTGYVDGKREGAAIAIDNTGRVVSLSTYHHDRLHGISKSYTLARTKEERTYKDGELHGWVKLYYEDGHIMEESQYSKGKRNGTATWYDQKGNVSIKYKYRDGQRIQEE